jgi:O-antigen ligase
MPSPSLSPSRTTPTTTRSSAAPRRATLADRLALLLIQLGAFAIVLAAVPYKTFELDRHLVPKELTLHIVAFSSALLCLAQRRRLELSRVDTFLVGWLALSFLSSLFATNWWLAGRYLAISVSGVMLFWTARTLAGAGLARPLLGTLAAAVVVGAVTALLQAYGVVSELASLSRAPGGTFGNRNFMAHLSAIGLPVLILFGLQSTTRFGLRLIAVGVALVTAALVLSRSRAAWLALGVCGFFLLWALWIIRLRHKEAWQGRPLRTMASAAAIGAFAALVLPNTLDWKSDSPYLDSVRGVVNYKEGSGAGRLVQYSRTLEMTLEHPLFGVGPGNWSLDYPRHAPRDDPSFSRGDGTTANPWPSSDWMAWLSERGIPAMIFLGLVFFGITVGALAEWGRAKTTELSLAATALLATLIVTVIEGAFDAVLLLPTPAFFAWTIFGALSPPSRPRAVFMLSAGKRLRAIAAVALFGLLIIYRSTAQLGAMSVFSTGPDLDALEQASRIDPGNYRIHMRLAEVYQSRGRCDRAKRHAQAAKKLLPTAPGPRRIVAECP